MNHFFRSESPSEHLLCNKTMLTDIAMWVRIRVIRHSDQYIAVLVPHPTARPRHVPLPSLVAPATRTHRDAVLLQNLVDQANVSAEMIGNLLKRHLSFKIHGLHQVHRPVNLVVKPHGKLSLRS